MVATQGAPSESRLDYALRYAALGWAVIPLHWADSQGRCSCGNAHCTSAGKHPYALLARHGSHSATTDADTLRRWFGAESRLNIGIATGEASGIVVVDVDPRNGGDGTLDDLVDRHGALPDTATAQTGGGGQHIVFRHQPGQSLRALGAGIDIKGNGGLIVVEPSGHVSGNTYQWLAEADPLEGAAIADPPEWMLRPVVAAVHTMTGRRATGSIDPQRVMDLRAAMAHLDADDYEVWYQVGMALHSTDAPEAFDLWDAWSQGSDKYDTHAQRKKWASFGQRDGLHVESIFTWAMDAGWTGESPRVATPAHQVRIQAPAPRAHDSSAGSQGLLEVPGALGDVVRLANETAPRPQPVFAVGAALALGSVVAGRRYRAMPRRNLSSLYFVHVGKSASGKEHARTIIETVLEAAEWPELIGSGGYASDSAVLSALMHQPAHIAIIDEIGALLGNAQSEGAMHQRAAITTLIEAWGNLQGTMRPKAYSSMALSKDQANELHRRVVHNPAITLLGMTTPRTFYGSLTEGAIEGGFLPRLIVIDTDIGRQPMGEARPLVVPDHLADWCKACRHHAAGTGNLGALDVGAGMRPPLTDVQTDPGATAAFAAYERDVLRAMDDLEQEDIEELEGRSVEKAMRIALILAVSCDPYSPRITADHSDWAIAFVRHWTARTIRAVRQNVHGSRFGEWQADVLRIIRKSHNGRTERELAKYSRRFSGLDLRQRKMVLDALQADGVIAFVETTGAGGRGRRRQAWHAIENEGEES